MLKKEARKITGGLSKPSKMPGPAHNLPAWNCITGAKLQKVKNFRGLQVPDTQAAAWDCSSSLAQAWRRPGGRRAAGAQALKLSSLTSPQAWDIIGLKRK